MKTKQCCIPLESPKEWKEALSGIKHTFGNTWENCYAMYLTTGLKTYLYFFEEDNARVVCPISEREFAGYVDIVKPYGFSGFVGNGFCPGFRLNWQEFVRERGYVCGYLGLNPIFDCSDHFDPAEIYKYDIVYLLDLTLSYDELFANMHRNRREQLRNWNDVKPDFICDKALLQEFFLDNYYNFLREKNASSFYSFSKETFSFLFSLDNVLLVGIRESGKVVAVSVFTYTDNAGDCAFIVSLPGVRNQSSALVWYGVNYLKSLGIPVLNLGGGGGGVSEFKRRFGCKELPLRCQKQVYKHDVYEMLCRQINADPKDMAGYFPAYRKG